jgi:hypothetical protein
MPDTYKSFGTGLTGSTAATTIYSGVVGTAVVNSINISNTDPFNSNTITVEMVKGSTAYSIIRNVNIPLYSCLQILDAPMVLDSGNTLRATAGITSGMDIIVSVLEIT